MLEISSIDDDQLLQEIDRILQETKSKVEPLVRMALMAR
jgi:hypothetical protein